MTIDTVDDLILLICMAKEHLESSPDAIDRYTHAQDGGYDDDLPVSCPPHTTDRRLVNKIDWRVLPWLCILYLLAFLDR